MSRLMLCSILSWSALGSALPVRADDAEDKAEEFFIRLGGDVTRRSRNPSHPGPVVKVHLDGERVITAAMKELAAFKDLTTL